MNKLKKFNKLNNAVPSLYIGPKQIKKPYLKAFGHWKTQTFSRSGDFPAGSAFGSQEDSAIPWYSKIYN